MNAGRRRHRRAGAQRGPRAAAGLRGDRRAALWRGQDRDPAARVMKLTAPLYMLRHGETAWNTERRMQGTKNSPSPSAAASQARRDGPRAQGRAGARTGPDDLPAQPARPHARDVGDRRPRARPRSCRVARRPAAGRTQLRPVGRLRAGRRSRPRIPRRSPTGAPIRTAIRRRAARRMSSCAAARPRCWPISRPRRHAPSWSAMA